MLSLVHLIYMAGDKCMRQNACYIIICYRDIAVYMSPVASGLANLASNSRLSPLCGFDPHKWQML